MKVESSENIGHPERSGRMSTSSLDQHFDDIFPDGIGFEFKFLDSHLPHYYSATFARFQVIVVAPATCLGQGKSFCFPRRDCTNIELNVVSMGWMWFGSNLNGVAALVHHCHCFPRIYSQVFR